MKLATPSSRPLLATLSLITAALLSGLTACDTPPRGGAVTEVVTAKTVSQTHQASHPSAARPLPSSVTASSGRVTKVLTIVEENHSITQMKSGMPYLYGLARRYGYSSNYAAITHPSLPNYLAITGGSTFGVRDDANPSRHVIRARSVFGQALIAKKRAGLYAESMHGSCVRSGDADRGYAVKHNPWAYFAKERAACRRYNRPTSTFAAAAKANALPNAAMLIPNKCFDAHDCSLGTADAWLRRRLPVVLGSTDFTSGRLVVVITADEDDGSDHNRILTVVLQARLNGSHKVVKTSLNHYSLSRLYSQVLGVRPLGRARTAHNMAAAFGLPLK